MTGVSLGNRNGTDEKSKTMMTTCSRRKCLKDRQGCCVGVDRIFVRQGCRVVQLHIVIGKVVAFSVGLQCAGTL